jgi:putative tryptophan/tyrosine transport system substrate-binding protein
MRRREFIAGLAGAVAWPLAGRAQQQPAIRAVGVIDEGSPGAFANDFAAGVLAGLAEMGFVEGRNVIVEHRFAEGHVERLPSLAAEMVLQNRAVIVAANTNSALAAKAATRMVPIVFEIGSDPVEIGLVPSFARPGGNLTGIAALGSEISGKRFELLRKFVPGAEAIAMLTGSPNSSYDQAEARGVQSAARALGVHLLLLSANRDSVSAAFATIAEQRVGALLVGGAIPLANARDQIISLAATHSIPTMFYYPSDVGAGGLLSYGPDLPEVHRQTGIYIGRILKGEKPADLPVQRPTRFKLKINLKTARTMGLETPPGVLAIADEVIE